MEMLPVSPERKAQLEDYAQRHGQDTAAALDEVLANYLEWERKDYNETVEGVLEAYEEVKAGRTQPADEFLNELRVKHGLPALTLPHKQNGTRTQFLNGFSQNTPVKQDGDGS